MSTIDLMRMFTTQPPELDFVLPGVVPGSVNLMTSPGGTGKSMWALLATMSVSCPPFNPLGLELNAWGKTLYLCLEDPATVLHQRLYTIAKMLSPSDREILVKNMRLEAMNGLGFDLLNSEWRKFISNACGGDTRLIVIDTLCRAHRLDENSNSEMSQLLSQLEGLAVETNTAILILHHSSKSMAVQGRGDEQQSARGASALVDNARWQSYLAGMSKEEAERYGINTNDRGYYVRFGIAKQNYGSPFSDRWYRRTEGGVLAPVDLSIKPHGRIRHAM